MARVRGLCEVRVLRLRLRVCCPVRRAAGGSLLVVDAVVGGPVAATGVLDLDPGPDDDPAPALEPEPEPEAAN